jgi:hypothetical protein
MREQNSLCNDRTSLYGPQRRENRKEFYKNLHSITSKINKSDYTVPAGDIKTTLGNKVVQDYTRYI